MTIGNECSLKLNELMNKKNISQSKLARRSGVSRAYINNLIQGDYSNPGILIVSRLCVGLGCSLDELIEINHDMCIEQGEYE